MSQYVSCLKKLKIYIQNKTFPNWFHMSHRHALRNQPQSMRLRRKEAKLRCRLAKKKRFWTIASCTSSKTWFPEAKHLIVLVQTIAELFRAVVLLFKLPICESCYENGVWCRIDIINKTRMFAYEPNPIYKLYVKHSVVWTMKQNSNKRNKHTTSTTQKHKKQKTKLMGRT